MKKNKIIWIVLLIAFIGIIVLVLTKVNSKSTEKNQNNTTTNNTATNTILATTNTTIMQSSGKVRKSTGKAKADMNNIISITDNFFIEQTNDMYLNLSDYIGKTIKIEGLIYYYEDENGDICYAVVRNTPGCCGNDGLAGVDIRYDEDYPAENTWVEVIGVVGIDTTYGTKIPAIQVASMQIKEAGVTFVTN